MLLYLEVSGDCSVCGGSAMLQRIQTNPFLPLTDRLSRRGQGTGEHTGSGSAQLTILLRVLPEDETITRRREEQPCDGGEGGVEERRGEGWEVVRGKQRVEREEMCCI